MQLIFVAALFGSIAFVGAVEAAENLVRRMLRAHREKAVLREKKQSAS